jgi:UDP-N-acetylglucosamine--N-acetylmuramyl-(pentapeptide) pyrophosphoryl-undecaprenol N-acetylglucosamine transferase
MGHHVVFAGGGTGGHLFPGLAAAECLRQELADAKITFCGTGSRFERKEVFEAGFAYRGFPCKPWPNAFRKIWRFLRDQRRGLRMASDFIRGERVDLVVGLGGYASLPMTRAASQTGVPVALLDQNAVLGRATRRLSRSAALVCLSFATARQRLITPGNVRITGNPVRELRSATGSRDSLPPRLLVTGGTQGATDLNQWVPRALYKVGSSVRDWRIIHQTGSQDVVPTLQLYRKFSIEAEVVPFIDDLPRWFGDTDLVVCRAGGTTLAELALCGVPAILVPLPNSSNDHQRINARCFTQAGAAVTIDPDDLCGRLDDELGLRMLPLMCDAQLRQTMGRSMSQLSFPDAARDVARAISDLLRNTPLARAA